jgi:CheY-like chemotaxis protein/HPt (histidine-containing phosphotransfer) domain-containing protein
LNRLGFAAEVANDGQEALAALAGKSYALLLTDCHMPNMDGFELAKSVRRDEAGGEARLPIVAITASAMQEDSDRCFEAGMDDFLVKPVELDKLKETLRRWMPEAAEDDEAPTVGTDDDAPAAGTDDDAPAAGSGASGPVDVSVLVDLFGGDPEPKILRDMLRAFVKPSLGILGDMRRALDGRSAVDVEAAAHKLKSSARAIGARDLAALCDSLEEAGKSDDWETIEKAAPRLEPSIDEVVRYIETY